MDVHSAVLQRGEIRDQTWRCEQQKLQFLVQLTDGRGLHGV